MAKPTVKVTDKSGVIQEVPLSDLPSYTQMGYTPATDADLAAAVERERYSGLGSGLAAGGLGALRGATVGLSDPLITKVGGEPARQYLEGVKEAHPDISTAGEIAGVVLPALVGDEAGLVGGAVKGIGLPSRLVGGLGGLAERAAVGVVGRDAAGLGARALQAAIRTGAQGAAEGFFYGAGSKYSEDALHDHETTAQSLLAAGYDGALYGGLAGGALGAGGEVVATAARKVGGLAFDLGSSIVGRKQGETLSEYLDRESGSKAFKAAGGTQNSVKLADTYAGGADAVGRVWRDEAPGLAGKNSFSALTRDDLVVAAEKGLEREGSRLEASLNAAQASSDARAASGLPSLAPKAYEVTGEVDALVNEALNKPGAKPVAAKLKEFSDDIKRITGMTDIDGNLVPHAKDIEVGFEQLRDFRRGADELWTSLSGSPELKGYKKEFKKLRSIMEDQLTNAGEAVSGSHWLQNYNDAKRLYQAFKILDKNASQGVARETANKTFGLTNTLSGNAAAGIGATLGSAIGGAPGAFIGSGIGKAIGTVGAKLVQKHGDFVSADVLARAAKINGLGAQTAKIGGTIAQAVNQFFDRSTATSAVTAGHLFREKKSSKEELQASIRHVQDLAGNPGKLTAAITNAIGPSLGQAAPKTAAAAASTMANGVAFLASKAPKGIGSQGGLLARPRHFTDGEISQYAKYHEGVTNPRAVIRGIGQGRVSRQGIEAIQAVYPKLYQQVQSNTLKQIDAMERMGEPKGKKRKTLSYSRKLSLGVMLGIPADDSLTPSFVASLQATKSGEAAPSNATQAPQEQGPRRELKGSEAGLQTMSERLTA